MLENIYIANGDCINLLMGTEMRTDQVFDT
jgi:hypothetical protein